MIKILIRSLAKVQIHRCNEIIKTADRIIELDNGNPAFKFMVDDAIKGRRDAIEGIAEMERELAQ